MSMRSFLEHLRAGGKLVEIDAPTSPELEMARVASRHDGQAVLFNDVAGYDGWRVAAGVASSREYFAMALGVEQARLIDSMVRAMNEPLPPPLTENAPCQEVEEPAVSLESIPFLRHLPADGGRYVTAGISVIVDPDYGRNVCFHRLMLLDGKRFAARVVEGRGTDTALGKTKDGLPVAICIGNSLPVLLAASMSPPKGVDELAIANALTPGGLQLARCKTVPIEVPADCELVLEGRITHGTAPEGPFADLTETMDFMRGGPVVEIDRVTHRRDPIYHALLPARMEHKLLMGMPREPTIVAAVNDACEGRCTNALITPGGTSWLHAVVQIEKRGPEDGRRAIEAAFRGHTSLKHVVVVDTDIDVYDAADVEWAIATRFQAGDGLVVMYDQPGSSLDPSARHTPGKKSRTDKVGLDATIPWGIDNKLFRKISYG